VNHRRPRGNVSTRLVLGIDPNTDEGRAKAFRNGAGECLIGALKLNDGLGNLTGEYILTFHALELGLKAFLAKSGLSNDKLRKKPFSHNLVNLYAEACKRGLSISLHQVDETIEWINEYHDQGALRYEFTQTRELPMCETLFPIVEAVLAASN
jgi:hypothetical protein